MINRFLNEYIIVSTNSEISINDLVETYKQWYINNINNSDMKIPNAEIGKQLLNSKIVKYQKRDIQYGLKLAGLRTIESGKPELDKGESFLCKIRQDEYVNMISLKL